MKGLLHFDLINFFPDIHLCLLHANHGTATETRFNRGS
jgi:hypothetical protein